uniref:Cellulase n=1 Tax=Caudovirales sp. ctVfb8 TaxID=2825766 RepID=A0A8S5V3B6_9CAUD|nr:MAG TPA: cellulase [Caudovirales sp. ctVfb8]DAU05963.1 MAG TPA: cellulase [Caudoviricetes sp.]
MIITIIITYKIIIMNITIMINQVGYYYRY